jgi:MoaA/NifB/PqqE/SkfB family radical SAM enzyme
MKLQLTDGLNFLSKLTPLRALNATQIVSSYIVSKITGKATHWGTPLSISLEPTTSCNLRCPECPSGLRSFTRPTGMLQDDFFKQTIDQLHKRLMYLIFYFQGEPYLHKNFLGLVKYASDRGIYTATSTNAHYLNDDMARKTVESGLDRLIVSIDGTTQETYASYRVGGKLDKVLEGTRNVVKWKKELNSKTPHIMFQFLVVKPNEHQLQDVKDLAKELEVDEVVFKTAQIYDYENGSPLIPTIDYYSRYQNNGDGSYSIKNKLLNHMCDNLGWFGCAMLL